MQDIVNNGVMTLPLYHGTSSLFVDSIREKGLGARNPIADYGVVQFLESIYPICEELFTTDDEWIARRVIIRPMMRQEVTAGGFNFQHGESYLTPCRGSAVGYALSNLLGSELISVACFLFRMIEKHRPGELERRAFPRGPLLKLFCQSPSPYLVTARNVPVQALVGERGNPVQEVIEQLRSLVEAVPDLTGVTFNINFRLTSPLSPHLLSIEQIDPKTEENPYGG